MTADDLRGYRVREGEPVAGRYRDLRVSSSTPPGGGVTLIQMLHILDRFPPATAYAPETYVLLAQAMREAFAERTRSMGDPEFVPCAVDELLGAGWADAAAERIRGRHVPAPSRPPGARAPRTSRCATPRATRWR